MRYKARVRVYWGRRPPHGHWTARRKTGPPCFSFTDTATLSGDNELRVVSVPMGHRFVCLALLGCILAANSSAAEPPGRGKLLVASRQLQGPAFAETVILLIHYEETGAMGLIVNRPTALTPSTALQGSPALAEYRGPLYLGGPVEQRRVLALVRSEQPPATAATVFAGVHVAPLSAELLAGAATDASRLRMYMGYAGWGPGQLDAELALGSWHVAPASDEVIFSDEPDSIWRRLLPAPRYRVANDPPDHSIGP